MGIRKGILFAVDAEVAAVGTVVVVHHAVGSL
jgi:hypothetical protein